MANEIFADTSGFWALLVEKDDRHQAATQVLLRAYPRTLAARYVTQAQAKWRKAL